MMSPLLRAFCIATFMATPAAAAATPPELEQRVSARFPGSDVRVIDQDGIVLLRGSVKAQDQRLEVEQMVRRAGYDRIANLLTLVAGPSDEQIRVAIERRLSSLRAVGLSEVSVRSSDGIVHLSGRIPLQSRAHVVDVVSRVEGVRQIVLNPTVE